MPIADVIREEQNLLAPMQPVKQPVKSGRRKIATCVPCASRKNTMLLPFS